ncbi:TetR/AcrR family transcriptional regulator [Bermanella marisrubri]|uniref:Transcriptional regulator n=1 Tax=Bermanella marisrubri TaxID=207949 RepID=Q1N497_9GAMM|nr:TetR/AcrR family transcriptional regulator [Bermanella marisrubri]EAT12968.1 transcriptional regulator [Oceanobacter sp. RED65] [Bermanella marisrubri]QIZ82904.1 TetR/AcrR family transcriptional regulator [Bermanella marisrubri]
MARRKDHSPEELSELVLKQVLEFLQSESADQLSLRKLAKMVGYSPGTLINLFGSYDKLILAANAKTLDIIADQIGEVMTKINDPEKRLQGFAHSYFDFAQQHPFQWQILFEHHIEDDEIPQWQMSRIDRLFDVIENCLESIKPNSDSADRHQVSRVIWAAVHGICTLATDDKLFAKDSINGQSMIDSLLTHYLGSWKNS